MKQTESSWQALWAELEKTHTHVGPEERRCLRSAFWAEQALQDGRVDLFGHDLTRMRRHVDQVDVRAASLRTAHKAPGEITDRLDRIRKPVPGSNLDEARARCLSRHIARAAAAREEVRAFRRDICGDPAKWLSQDDGLALLKSPAAGFLPMDLLARDGVPPVGHAATLEVLESGVDEGGSWQEVRFEVKWPHGRVEHRRRIWSFMLSEKLEIDSPDPAYNSLRVCEGSILDRLRKAAGAISTMSTWTESSAAWFILTGVFPVHRPLTWGVDQRVSQGGDFDFAVVRLAVQPFVLPKTVAAAYARAQLELLEHLRGPAISQRNLSLVDFVEHRTAQEGARPSYEALRSQWNRLVRGSWNQPTWIYDEFRALRRDYLATKKRVLTPNYPLVFPGLVRRSVPVEPLPKFFRYELDSSGSEQLCGCVKCYRTAPCKLYALRGRHSQAPNKMWICAECHRLRPRISFAPAELGIGQAIAAYSWGPEESAPETGQGPAAGRKRRASRAKRSGTRRARR